MKLSLISTLKPMRSGKIEQAKNNKNNLIYLLNTLLSLLVAKPSASIMALVQARAVTTFLALAGVLNEKPIAILNTNQIEERKAVRVKRSLKFGVRLRQQ